MASTPQENGRKRGPAMILIGAIAVCAGIAVWLLVPKPKPANGPGAPPPVGPADDVVAASDVERFYVGVAALDVEANQRAGQVFGELSRSIPAEPAVWANLAVTHLRLNELPQAREALAKADELAAESGQWLPLKALIEERSGNFERAIELLQQVDRPDAETLYQLASLVERTGRDASTQERLGLINRILDQLPSNLVAQFQRARLAARLESKTELIDALDALAEHRDEWNEQAAQQYASAREAAENDRFPDAARHLAFLENLSRSTAPYQDGILALGVTGGSVGEPVRQFISLRVPTVTVAEPDDGLTYEPSFQEGTEAVEMFVVLPAPGEQVAMLLSLSDQELRVGDVTLPFPGRGAVQTRSLHAVAAVDLNSDYHLDIVGVGDEGISIFVQNPPGTFTPVETGELFARPGTGIWPLDFEADGDLDLLIAVADGTSQVLRNNGDMTFTPVDALGDLPAPRTLYWVDFDNDGDVDIAALDGAGRLLVAWNERAGTFTQPQPPLPELPTLVAAGFADVDLDGAIDLLALDVDGIVHRFAYETAEGEWSKEQLAHWENAPDLSEAFESGRVSLHSADLDNNGAVDLVASAGTQSALWLGDSGGEYTRLNTAPALFVSSVADVDGDGLLDLAGLSADGGQVAKARGTKDYRWQVVQPRANPNAADQRINSFGRGGRIELRAGRLLQVAPITAARVPFGLGTHEQAGVARIVWPNGTVQAEFDLAANQGITAEQRLKGSCPWVFTRNADGLQFVKDFIWRSPLGLKINSQDTAGVTQTEDWIKIPGELLTATQGNYEVRITAELWETHFFDLISLLVVDHPSSHEMFVDERFVPAEAPTLGVNVVMPPRALSAARNETGRDVSHALAAIDGHTVDDFALGRFQGLAEEHWIEFQLPEHLPEGRDVVLVGHGWIYPTDSSLNVAISQGDFAKPHGLLLEAAEHAGAWRPTGGDLGFPAGKHKTVLIPIPSKELQSGTRRFRLRTNLEVYWDFLAWSASPAEEVPMRMTRLEAETAELRYRGFSELSPLDRRRPDIPVYNNLAGTAQRWRDLEGYYTAFGDVRELLTTVDDRYLIMNAGDEIVLKFPALEPPQNGWTRDFVLIGDGWVKDGDFNTTHSRTVHPLPTHGNSDYSRPAGRLEDDPVYQQHRADWHHFHTRYITPGHFARGLWPASTGPSPRIHD